MRNPALALGLALTLALAAAPARADGGLMDDMSKVRDNFFYKTYTGMLGNEAKNGDAWSTLRLRELDKAVKMSEEAKKYDQTSWWNPIDKVSNAYGAWSSSNDYFDAAKQRRDWEKKLADAGITPSGKKREQAAENTVKFLGIFSDTAREGSRLIDQMHKTEDSAYKYSQTSWLHPIDKIDAAKDALKDVADANVTYRNFKNIASNDPFVRLGTSLSGLGSTIGNLLGGGNRTGTRDVYAGGSGTPRNTGRITDALGGANAGDDPFGLNGMTRNINQATQDMKRSFEEIRISVKGIKRQFTNGVAEINRQASSAANGCSGPNCPPAADRVNVNQLLEKLSGKGIK